jgi:hypothetical protein
MAIKWMAGVMIFLFCLVGLEIYRNTELVKASYTLQKLQSIRKNLEKENGYLKQKLSSSLSLRSLESRARGNLGLGSPQEIRFIREDLLQMESKSIPFPLRAWKVIKEMFGKLRNLLL